MDVRKSPAEAGLSRSPSKRTCPPDCPSPTRSEGTAQSSGIGGKPPTQASSALLVAHAEDLRTEKSPASGWG